MEELMVRIENPENGAFLKHIDWNFEEMKTKVSEFVKDYSGVVYSEEQIKSAKTDRAELNKLKTAIADKRKEVKKAINAPYDQFEKEVKEIDAILTGAISQIDVQVKGFENKQKEAKKAKLVEFYNAFAGDEVKKVAGFDRIFNEKWLNASVPEKKAAEELKAVIDNIDSDLNLLGQLEDDVRISALSMYGRTLDYKMVMTEVQRMRMLQKEYAERQAEEQKKFDAQVMADKAADMVRDALSEEVESAVEKTEEKVEVKPEEDNRDYKVKLNIIFNGSVLSMLCNVLKKNNIASRGKMEIEVLGKSSELKAFRADLEGYGIKYSVPEK